MKLGLNNNLVTPNVGAVGAEFSLTEISGLQAWYKFDTNITLNGSTVSEWGDSSGNGNDLTQTTASEQPAYNSGDIDFDGSNDYMALDSALDLTSFTIFAVIDLDDTTNETLLGNGSTNADFFRIAGSTWTLRTDGNSFQNNMSTTAGTNKHLLTLYTDVGASSTTYYLEADGTAESNAAIDNRTFTVGDIGRNSAGAQFFNGKVSEVAIFNTALSTADRETVEQDIMTRNGL